MNGSPPILGRLEPVPLRTVWSREDLGFTPWLAEPANLDLLAATLGLKLELEGTETKIGPFRADILCREVCEDRLVLIENQLERTDHAHLGQLIIYMAGLDAATIVIGPDDDPANGGWLRSPALNADPTDESDWTRQFAWMADTLDRYRAALEYATTELRRDSAARAA
jgi:hypothetical protein